MAISPVWVYPVYVKVKKYYPDISKYACGLYQKGLEVFQTQTSLGVNQEHIQDTAYKSLEFIPCF